MVPLVIDSANADGKLGQGDAQVGQIFAGFENVDATAARPRSDSAAAAD